MPGRTARSNPSSARFSAPPFTRYRFTTPSASTAYPDADLDLVSGMDFDMDMEQPPAFSDRPEAN
ncbi:hypothetical protein GCM10010298_44560 [Streptomyces microflavus]|uniref:Uncharacterized protein n=1 Tax=Streptomyces microflavus TaxID=1919 RepID=A0A7J0CWG0_STRMI|nr:hypothetical protein Smic_46110 [Streptomyces microflavus]GGX74653.1 hypothetical protein GCM10010298_44560 [Streptomyces microflavus]